ncbi:hypothetical protein EVAR_76295_1 [Eumeta japonica]|uniref:Mariner Mos1 transposase n=1 Tax=Eumeta variegata TaxID=151549 RepID=A0A4C1UPR1_EUMVA|nr:hypothetical protein EVAR_76295_1 [Eumeta japonica]
MVSVLQESAPSYTMVKKWLAYFNKDERAVKMILAQGVPVTESMQWTKKEKGRRRNSRFKVGNEAYGDNFWDSEGVLLIDYLPKGTTMNGQYYANLLAQARGSRTEAKWEVIARSAVFTRQCICPHGAGFEAGPEGHRLRKLTTHPTAQI